MSLRSMSRTRSDLSEFLTRHRKKLTPSEVGMPMTAGRRTAGLRREEVAALAGVGLTWYTWFEQGREIQVSESFVLKVAKALRLDDVECSQLFLLAHRRPPPTVAQQWLTVGPFIQQILDDLVERPAYVLNLRWDLVAWNPRADEMLGLADRDPRERNLLRLMFTDPALRQRLPLWQDDARKIVTQFRAERAATSDDPAFLELVATLKKVSPDFRRWFETPQADGYAHAISRFIDSSNRPIAIEHETLIVDEHRHLRMVVCFQVEGY